MAVIISWVLLGLIIGGMLGGALGDSLANHPGDIGAIFAGLMAGAMLGALCAGFVAIEINRRHPPGSRARKWIVASTWAMPVVVALAGWMFETWRTWDDLMPSGGAGSLSYELRLPAGMPIPEATAVEAEFRTEKEIRKPAFAGNGIEVARVGNIVVVTGSFETRKTAVRRSIRIRPGGTTTYLFNLKELPPRPPQGYSQGFSRWQGAEQVEESGAAPRAPRTGEGVEIRYKMDVI